MDSMEPFGDRSMRPGGGLHVHGEDSIPSQCVRRKATKIVMENSVTVTLTLDEREEGRGRFDSITPNSSYPLLPTLPPTPLSFSLVPPHSPPPLSVSLVLM